MIIVLKPLSPKEDIERVENMVKARGLDTHVIEGAEMTIIGCIGDTSRIDAKLFEVDPAVTKVMHVQEPYKLASRAFHPDNSIIDVSGVKVGGDNLALIAGPCSVESVDQVLEIAKAAKASGANMLRGGAFKPRTSPYSFQGLGLEGLNILCEAKAATGLPIVTELMSTEYLDVFNGPDTDWCKKHAELRSVETVRTGRPPDSSETWSKRYLRRVADVCRIHYGIR